jgi:mono/diheme cytochrome c family protein
MATTPRFLLRAVLPLVSLLAAPVGISAADTAAFDHVVKPFLATHCTACHGEKKQRGDLRFDTTASNFQRSISGSADRSDGAHL